MDVSLRHHAVERRGDAQVSLNLLNGPQRLFRRILAVLERLDAATVGFGGPLRNLKIIPRDHAWGGRCRPQPLVSALVGRQPGFGLDPLGFGALHFRLGFGALGGDLGSNQPGDELTRFHPRSSIYANPIHEAGHFRIHGHNLVGPQLGGQADRDIERLQNNSYHVNRWRLGGAALIVRGRGRSIAAWATRDGQGGSGNEKFDGRDKSDSFHSLSGLELFDALGGGAE